MPTFNNVNINVEFNDNYGKTSPNLVSNESINTSLAKIHKRFDIMSDGAYHSIPDSFNPLDYGSEIVSQGVLNEVVTPMNSNISTAINNGAKNLLKITNAVFSETKRGITATYDTEAGTITLNGTHDGTDTATFYLYNGNYADQPLLPQGSYHLSGCFQGGSTSTWRVILTSLNVYDSGNGADFTISNDTSRIAPFIAISKPSGQTVSFNNAVFKPMICLKSEWDNSNEFVPYGETNALLTYKSNIDNQSLKTLVDESNKNLLNWAVSGSYTSIQFTDNGDGTFYVSGTPESVTSIEVGRIYGHAGEIFVLSGCPAGGSQANSYSLLAANAAGSSFAFDEGSGCSFKAPSGESYFRIYLRLRAGTYTNLLFKPMVCYRSYWDISDQFVPYCESLQEVKTSKQNALTATQMNAVNSGATSEFVSNVSAYCNAQNTPTTLVASDYERGGIGSTGSLVDSTKNIRTIGYVPTNINSVNITVGEIYVKLYKNDAFVGNLEQDGTINATNHHSFKGCVNLVQVYKLDPDYRIKLVYNNGTSTTLTSEVTNVRTQIRTPLVLTGKKVSFFGDSISTFSGWIPSGNKAYYTGSVSGVADVSQTWWMRTLRVLNGTLLVNNSWSGRCVSNKRDAETNLVNSGAWRQTEVDKLAANGVTPDIIIVKLGINDFNNNVQEGTYDCKDVLPTVPADGPSTFREAYATMLDRIMTTYPLAKVYCCTLNQCERRGSVGFPEINTNGDSITEFNEAIRSLANSFGAGIIEHNASGMTYYNMSTYTGDWASSSGQGLHPNANGMQLLANSTVSKLLELQSEFSALI